MGLCKYKIRKKQLAFYFRATFFIFETKNQLDAEDFKEIKWFKVKRLHSFNIYQKKKLQIKLAAGIRLLNSKGII